MTLLESKVEAIQGLKDPKHNRKLTEYINNKISDAKEREEICNVIITNLT